MKYTIIKDTREQQGWTFSPYGDIEGMEVATVKTGDYTIKGYEDLVAIERKKSPTELALNLGKEIDRFEREMERMSRIPHAFVLCEFNYKDLIDYPKGITVPAAAAKSSRMNGPFMLKKINELQIKYGVQFMFCGSTYGGWQVACSIFKRVMEKVNGKL